MMSQCEEHSGGSIGLRRASSLNSTRDGRRSSVVKELFPFLVNAGRPSLSRTSSEGVLSPGGKLATDDASKQQIAENKTVYVCNIDPDIDECQLTTFFESNCGPVLDCRMCADPRGAKHQTANSRSMRFGFVQFEKLESAQKALDITGVTIGGEYAVKILRSKTEIRMVNPDYLPQTPDDIQRCSRTVYVANIHRACTKAQIESHFETKCGAISSMCLIRDVKNGRGTRIAFIEFKSASSAVLALELNGSVLPMPNSNASASMLRITMSKTPISK